MLFGCARMRFARSNSCRNDSARTSTSNALWNPINEAPCSSAAAEAPTRCRAVDLLRPYK